MVKVTIVDDTGRLNASERLSPMQARARGLSMDTGYLLVRDGRRKQVQEVVDREITYDGKQLEVVLNRARRWLRSGRLTGAPKHVARALAVLGKHDMAEFQALVKEAHPDSPE